MDPTTTPELSLLRMCLERQAEALGPVAARLHEAVVHPPVSPYDWHGPASDSYAALESHLRARIRAAEAAVTAALHSTRAALGQLDG
jgi:hypothetical protein